MARFEASRSDTPGDSPAANVLATGPSGRRPPKIKLLSELSDVVSAKPSGKPTRRSKRNVALAVPTASAAVKNTRGRATRSNPLPATASQVTTTVDGSRKRRRSKKDDVATPYVSASTVAPSKKKRGRKPNVEVVAAKKVRKTRKSTHGQKDSSVAPVAAKLGDFKKKTALLLKKVKEAAAKLKLAVQAIDEVQVIAAGM